MTRAVIRVIFEDTHLAVIDKPAGLLSQGDITGDTSVVDWGREHFGRHYVGLIHRLDRETSGLMVLAKRTKSAERLTRALQSGTLKRTYFALLSGALNVGSHDWKDTLLKDEANNTVRVVTSSTPGAKQASLTVLALKQIAINGRVVTEAEFRLETGRSHQIRVQAASRKLALVGDRKYGGMDFQRLALHSCEIEFPHPMSGEKIVYRSEAPFSLT